MATSVATTHPLPLLCGLLLGALALLRGLLLRALALLRGLLLCAFALLRLLLLAGTSLCGLPLPPLARVLLLLLRRGCTLALLRDGRK